jgi:hypothetical protein
VEAGRVFFVCAGALTNRSVTLRAKAENKVWHGIHAVQKGCELEVLRYAA